MEQKTFSGLISKPRLGSDYIRGVNSPIPYIVRNDLGDWREDYPTFFGQKFAGKETSLCWCFGAMGAMATQCNFLLRTGQFPPESIQWFKDNGYLDSNGKFAFSEDFIGIISGVKNAGNDHIEAWRLARLNGLLPRSDLSFDQVTASQLAFDQFIEAFFDPKRIKPAMRQKALDSKKYLNIAYEWITKEFAYPTYNEFEACLKHSPVQVGVPVCPSWNSGSVMACGDNSLAHSVYISNIRANLTRDFRDTYHPEDKVFSADYPITMALHGVVTPVLLSTKPPETAKPYPDTINSQVWYSVWWDWIKRSIGV